MDLPIINKINTNKKTIPVFLSISNGYFKIFSVLLISMISNLDKDCFLDVIVFSNENLNITNEECILKLKKEYKNFDFRYINVSDIIENWNPYVRGHVTIMTYLRFLAPYLMKDYDKAIYLDGDTLVIDNIASLYDIDLKDCMVGAVRDAAAAGIYSAGKHFDVINLFDNTLKLDNPFDYFQAGVLVVNMAKFRDKFELPYLMKLCEEKKWYFVDQDVLNLICKNDVLYIDMRWNVETKTALETPLKFSPKEVKVQYNCARLNPSIVHFAGAKKPWENPKSDFAELFFRYAKLSPFFSDEADEQSNILHENMPIVNAALNGTADDRVLIRCTTPLHLFNAINIRLTLYKESFFVVVLTNDIDWTDIIFNLKKNKIFDDVILSESTRDVSNYNQLNDTDKKRITMSPEGFLRENGFGNELDYIENHDIFTDIFYALSSKTEWLLYYYILKHNSNSDVKVHLYEEGTASYIFDHYSYIQNNDFFPRYVDCKSYLNSIVEYSVYNPELICLKNIGFNITQLPNIYNEFKKVKLCCEEVFGQPFLPDEKFIYFDSPCFDEMNDYCNLDILDQIADIVGIENIIVKLHPRTKTNRYSTRGYKIMEKSAFLWEINCFDESIKNKVFLSDLSTAAINSYNIFNFSNYIVNLHRLNLLSNNPFLKSKGAHRIISKLEEIKSPIVDYIRAPRNLAELREVLLYLKGEDSKI